MTSFRANTVDLEQDLQLMIEQKTKEAEFLDQELQKAMLELERNREQQEMMKEDWRNQQVKWELRWTTEVAWNRERQNMLIEEGIAQEVRMVENFEMDKEERRVLARENFNMGYEDYLSHRHRLIQTNEEEKLLELERKNYQIEDILSQRRRLVENYEDAKLLQFERDSHWKEDLYSQIWEDYRNHVDTVDTMTNEKILTREREHLLYEDLDANYVKLYLHKEELDRIIKTLTTERDDLKKELQEFIESQDYLAEKRDEKVEDLQQVVKEKDEKYEHDMVEEKNKHQLILNEIRQKHEDLVTGLNLKVRKALNNEQVMQEQKEQIESEYEFFKLEYKKEHMKWSADLKQKETEVDLEKQKIVQIEKDFTIKIQNKGRQMEFLNEEKLKIETQMGKLRVKHTEQRTAWQEEMDNVVVVLDSYKADARKTAVLLEEHDKIVQLNKDLEAVISQLKLRIEEQNRQSMLTMDEKLLEEKQKQKRIAERLRRVKDENKRLFALKDFRSVKLRKKVQNIVEANCQYVLEQERKKLLEKYGYAMQKC
ncbi:unnamed protein product [Amoebophrya sp. A120]|nr:unnamed protein product [Amoebophrya sp. A120]|eukprot:GSA120T00007017001.1